VVAEYFGLVPVNLGIDCSHTYWYLFIHIFMVVYRSLECVEDSELHVLYIRY